MNFDITKVKLDEIVESAHSGLISMYFTAPKEWVQDQYPNAAGTELLVEYPADNLSSDHFVVSVSPTDSEGTDFAWESLSLPEKDSLQLLCNGFLQRKEVPYTVVKHPDFDYIPPHPFKTLFQLLHLQDELQVEKVRATTEHSGSVLTVDHLIHRCLEEALTEAVLTQDQSNALLDLPDPLNSITQEIKANDNLSRDYLPSLLADYADRLIQERSTKLNAPVCRMTWKEAAESNCTEVYRQSYALNEQCASAMTAAIHRHYRNNRLDTAGAYGEVSRHFSNERILYLTANTIRRSEHDKRYSAENVRWAKEQHIVPESCPILSDLHPGLLNMYASYARQKNVTLDYPNTLESQIESLEKQKQSAYLELAMDLDLYSWAFHYADYTDQVSSPTENIKSIVSDLEKGETAPYFQFLLQTYNERTEPHIRKAVTSLSERLDSVSKVPQLIKNPQKEHGT